MPGNGLTKNDISEMLDILSKAMKPISTKGPVADSEYATTEIMDVLDKMMYKVPSVGNMVIAPMLSSLMKTSLGPMIEKAKAMDDWYGKQVEADIDAGRFDRMSDLLKLSALNQMRLSYGKQPYFEPIRNYIAKTYHADISDADCIYGFVPAKTKETSVLWHIIETLSNKGLVVIKEEYALNDYAKVVVIMLSRGV